MDTILKRIGYSKGTVGQRMKALARDPRYQFPDNDQGRAQVMQFIQKRLTAIRAKMPQAFNTLVRGNVEVRRLPPEEEPGAAGAYGGAGSIDGTIPGKFWINLKPGLRASPLQSPDLVHHEAIPGHVWQGEYANKLPLIRTLLAFNAYSEGWALYSEQLAGELGSTRANEVGRLGYLDSIAFRAARLVVDTGLHAKRWTPRAGAPLLRSSRPAIPNRERSRPLLQLAGPGLRLRDGASGRSTASAIKAEGGAWVRATTCKAFDDAVVLGGNVPMDVLASNIDDYIATDEALSCLRRLPRLRPDPGVDPVFEHRQRHRSQCQDRIVEGALVELRPELRLGFGAQPADGQLAELVGQRLSRPADVAVDLGLDLMLRQRGVAREIVDRLLARPAVAMDAGVDHQPRGAPHLVA